MLLTKDCFSYLLVNWHWMWTLNGFPEVNVTLHCLQAILWSLLNEDWSKPRIKKKQKWKAKISAEYFWLMKLMKDCESNSSGPPISIVLFTTRIKSAIQINL